MKKPSVLSSVITDKKTYGTAHREVVFENVVIPPERVVEKYRMRIKKEVKKRSKVDKVVAKSLNLKRAHCKHVNVSPAQMDLLCARVRKLLVWAFLAGILAAALCCYAVNASALHRAYLNGYSSGKDSKVINYFTDTTP